MPLLINIIESGWRRDFEFFLLICGLYEICTPFNTIVDYIESKNKANSLRIRITECCSIYNNLNEASETLIAIKGKEQ